jgi:hypothetical protein
MTAAAVDRRKTRLALPAAILALGAFTYLVRGVSTLGFHWTGVSEAASATREALAPVRATIPRAVLGVLPDIAWAAALALVLTRLRSSRGFLVAGFALCFGWEIGQGLSIVPGTFDIADLVTSSAAYLAVVFLDRFSTKGLHHDVS